MARGSTVHVIIFLATATRWLTICADYSQVEGNTCTGHDQYPDSIIESYDDKNDVGECTTECDELDQCMSFSFGEVNGNKYCFLYTSSTPRNPPSGTTWFDCYIKQVGPGGAHYKRGNGHTNECPDFFYHVASEASCLEAAKSLANDEGAEITSVDQEFSQPRCHQYGPGEGRDVTWNSNTDTSYTDTWIYPICIKNPPPAQESPNASPTFAPTASPTTANPTLSPTASPTTANPTLSPTASPTSSPTSSPTNSPTTSPTGSPTTSPTDSPTTSPTDSPTTSPTDSPTQSPSMSPTYAPTVGFAPEIKDSYSMTFQANCSNGIMDQNETDTDCGSSACMGCGEGMDCVVNSDCFESTCVNFVCTRTLVEVKVLIEAIVLKLTCDQSKEACAETKQLQEASSAAPINEEELPDFVPAAITFEEASFEKETHTSSEFKKTFCEAVVEPLGIPPSRCAVLSVRSGSVIVDYVLIGISVGDSSIKTKTKNNGQETVVATNRLSQNQSFAATVAASLSQKLNDTLFSTATSSEAASVALPPNAAPSASSSLTPIIVIASILAIALATTAVFVPKQYLKLKAKNKVLAKVVAEKAIEAEIVDCKVKNAEKLKDKMEKGLDISQSDIHRMVSAFAGLEKAVRLIPFDDLHFEEELGKGAFATVHRAVLHRDFSFLPAYRRKEMLSKRREMVAVKQMHMKVLRDQKALDNFRNEVLLMASLRPHVNVIKLIGISLDGGPANMGIVLEYAGLGDLRSLLHKNDEEIEGGSWKERYLEIVLGIARGMKHLHRQSYVHRDIKPGNVLLGSSYRAKLGDLGESRVVDTNFKMTQLGTPYYTAPEILNDDFYDSKVDVYSFGILLNEVDTREIPYTDASTGRVRFVPKYVVDGQRPALHGASASKRKLPDSSPAIRDLIVSCWNSDPNERPTSREIVDILEKELKSFHRDLTFARKQISLEANAPIAKSRAQSSCVWNGVETAMRSPHIDEAMVRAKARVANGIIWWELKDTALYRVEGDNLELSPRGQ